MTSYGYGSPQRPRRLEGPDRGLDALVGLVILIAELLIGLLSLLALYAYGVGIGANAGVDFGFGIALLGGGAIVFVTTLVYLVRIASARRSWTAPLWGLILMSAALVIGYAVMTGSA